MKLSLVRDKYAFYVLRERKSIRNSPQTNFDNNLFLRFISRGNAPQTYFNFKLS